MCNVEYPFQIGKISSMWNNDNNYRWVITEPPIEIQLLQKKIEELEKRIAILEKAYLDK